MLFIYLFIYILKIIYVTVSLKYVIIVLKYVIWINLYVIISKFQISKFKNVRDKSIRLKIIEAIEVESSGEPGKVLEGELIIACRKNAIKVLFIQKEGKKVLQIKDFLAGHKINIGEKLI